MNGDVKTLWVAALREPGRDQIQAYLGDVTGGRCCLGVLCDLAVAAGVIPPPTEETTPREHRPTMLAYGPINGAPAALAADATSISMPPVAVARWAGVELYSTFQDLAELNDSGRTFADIADVIERDW